MSIERVRVEIKDFLKKNLTWKKKKKKKTVCKKGRKKKGLPWD
jgi:hypothetical protein